MSKIIPIYRDYRDKLIKNKNMKPLLLIVLCFVFIAMGVKDKTYKVELPLVKWQNYFTGIEATKQNLKNSDIQARTVNLLIDSFLTPLSNEIATQISAQLTADSTKKK